MSKLCLFLLMIVQFLSLSHAQSDSLLYSKYVSNPAEKLYYTNWDQKTPLYQGRIFYDYSATIQGHVFYKEKEWKNGAVLYGSIWYYDIPLKYDIFSDNLIAKAIDGEMGYIIDREKIGGFIIGGNHFWNLSKDNILNARAGLYQAWNEGSKPDQIQLYIRRAKELHERTENSTLVRSFEESNEFYVIKSGKSNRIKTKKQALSLMGSKRKDAAKALREAGLKYNKGKELVVTFLIEYYNSLLIGI